MLLGSEKKCDVPGSKTLANDASTVLKDAQGVLKFPVLGSGSTDDERAVADGFGDGGEFFRVLEKVGSADGAHRLPKSWRKGIDDAQPRDAEVAHGAGRRSDVEGVAGGDEHHAQTVEIAFGSQTWILR